MCVVLLKPPLFTYYYLLWFLVPFFKVGNFTQFVDYCRQYPVDFHVVQSEPEEYADFTVRVVEYKLNI